MVTECNKVMFCFMYLHTTARCKWRKEGNVLFNDTLNTFYLRLYGVRHKVNDHSDSERGNPLPPQGLLFPISSNGSFICTIPETAFVTPVVEHWLEREIAQWVHHEGSIRRSIVPWANALTTELHLDPRCKWRQWVTYNFNNLDRIDKLN